MSRLAVSIHGTGHIGLPQGAVWAQHGIDVVCYDTNESLIRELSRGTIRIKETGLDEIVKSSVEAGLLRFSSNLVDTVQNRRIHVLTVPTPRSEDGTADTQYVERAALGIAACASGSKDQGLRLYVIKSTVPVGTAQRVRSLLEEKGYGNFIVVSCPEFMPEGRATSPNPAASLWELITQALLPTGH